MTTVLDSDIKETRPTPTAIINRRDKNDPKLRAENSQSLPSATNDVPNDAQFWPKFNSFIVLYKMSPAILSLWASGLLIYLAVRIQHVITKVGPVAQIIIHKDSWPFPYEDRGDPQWNSFIRAIPSIIGLMTSHLLLTHTVDKLSKYNMLSRFYFQALFGSVALYVTHGLKGALIVLLFGIIYYAISLLSRRSSFWTRTLSWTLTIALCLGNFKQFRQSAWFNRTFGFIIPLNPLVAMPIAIRFLAIRGHSFVEDKVRAFEMQANPVNQTNAADGKENCSKKERKKGETSLYFEDVINRSRRISDYSAAGFLAYVVYLPVYSAGPITTYNAFAHYASVRTKANRKWIIEKIVSIAAMMLCTHIINRVYLPLSLSRNFQYWEHMSLLELNLLVAITLLYVWLKLKTLWDLFRFWSVLAGYYVTDNMAEFLFNVYRQVVAIVLAFVSVVINVPLSCSQRGFWKFWHHSYHLYLSRYIYLPLGGRTCPLLANICVFGFVALWHVLDTESVVWFGLTVVGIAFENVLRQLFQVNIASYPPRVWKHPQIAVCACAVITILVCWTQYIMHGCYVAGIKVLITQVKRRPHELLGVLLFVYLLVMPLRASQLVQRSTQYMEGKPQFVFDFTSSGDPVVEEIDQKTGQQML